MDLCLKAVIACKKIIQEGGLSFSECILAIWFAQRETFADIFSVKPR